MNSILEINQLSKRFGKTLAVDQLSMTVPKGAVFGILGPNGSGKSTTLGMVLGAINPTGGEFLWFGAKQNHTARKRIGAILEAPSFYHYLNADENLRVVANIKGVSAERIDPVLARVGLLARKKDAFKTYSLGMKQRLAIASALLADPEVMILDEPTNGLDPQGIAEIRDLVQAFAAEGRTVIIASHLLDEVQRICTDFAVLRFGKLIFQGRVDELNQSSSQLEISATDKGNLELALNKSNHVESLSKQGDGFAISLKPGNAIAAFHTDLIAQGIVLTKLQVNTKTLESKFLEILKSKQNG